MNLVAITITIALLLTGILCWNEVMRPNKKWLAGRLISVIVLGVAMACLALPISYPVENTEISEASYGLLTKGFSRDSLSLKKTMKYFTNNLVVYQEEDSLLVDFTPNLSYFLASHQQVSALHIFGQGPEDLTFLEEHPNLRVIHHQETKPSGIVSVHWPTTLTAGSPLVVQGHYSLPDAKNIKLVLKGVGTTLDSINIPKADDSEFSLTTTPKNLGKAVYKLQVIQNGDTLQNEPIPLEVTPAPTMKILILNSSPDFESRFLKDWLFDHQHGVAIRNQVSKDLFSKEFLNIETLNLTRLTNTLLDNFDVVMADQDVLKSLRSSEKVALAKKISGGMGLIIRSSGSKGVTSFDKSFQLYQQPVQSAQKFTLSSPVFQIKPTELSLIQSWYLRPQGASQIVIQDQRNRVMVEKKLWGQGKLVMSTLHDTQQLILEGDPESFANLWSGLLSAALPEEEDPSAVFPDMFAVENAPYDITVVADSNDHATLQIEDNPIPLAQKINHRQLWDGTFWPTHTGWTTVLSNDRDTSSLYVMGKEDWQSVRGAATYQKNQHRFEQRNATGKLLATPEVSRAEIPKAYFFIIILLCCSFLWIENKILK